MFVVLELRCKKFCMCNRYDKWVLGGVMMVGSSDLEIILFGCLICVYFCLRVFWSFFCRGFFGLLYFFELWVIWFGVFLEFV